jgi:hypothetical protein
MSIKFLCPNCKKVVSVKDELAGKKGKCPHCTKVLTVPVPAKPSAVAPPVGHAPGSPSPAPPPHSADAEAEAAAALADGTTSAPAAESATIDFTCPMCDAQVRLPLAEAGKRAPCPECKRIIKVPEPEKRDPANWRQAGPSLPSGAKRQEEKAPEGAWGSAAAAALVSRESLREAGAVPQKKEPVSLSRRIVRIAAWAGGAILLIVLAVLGYLKWLDTREEQAAESALSYADGPGKADLGPYGRAAVYRLAGDYYLRTRQPGCAKSAHDAFEKSLAAVREGAGAPTERDALLQDLARAEVELGGSAADVDAKLNWGWDDVQRDLKATLGEIKSPEAKLEALRVVARRLAAQGEEKRATALTNALYPSDNFEKADALGAVGLELWTAGKKEAAGAAADEALRPYRAKDRPALAPAAVALAVIAGREAPEPNKQSVQDQTNALLGQAEALTHLKQRDAARKKVQEIPNPSAETLLRADVMLAAADLDDKHAGNADATAAVQRAQPASTPASSWLLLRLTRIGARAGVAPDALKEMAVKVPDADLRGRAQLAALQAQFAQGKQAADPKVFDAVESKTVAAWLARAEWARRTSGSSGVVKGWDGPNRAFGQLGLGLGPQGDE